MGKSRNKNKDKDVYQKKETHDYDSDDDGSVTTYTTCDDMDSLRGDIDNVDDIIDKLAEHIDNAQHKNAGVRQAALLGVQKSLASEYLPDVVEKYKVTLLDFITKYIRNKPDEEAQVCAKILALVAIQIGGEISEDVEDALAALRIIVADPTRSVGIRETAALSLALTSRLASESDDGIAASIKATRTAWTSIKNSSKFSTFFHSALSSWCLLLADATGESLNEAIKDQPKIVSFLQADHLDIRIAAGEALAYLHEFFADCRPGFRFPNHEHAVELINGLSSEFTKGKTKKDKRIQRYTFRDISSFMSGRGDCPTVSVKFSSQTLVLDNCAIKLFYDVCCQILHGGMMRHLQSNEFIRDLFDLGPVSNGGDGRTEKMAKMAVYDAADKYRNQVRGRQRDKRSVLY